MQRVKRLILSALVIAAVFSGTVAHAAATNLPAGMLIGDQYGITVGVDGAYFIDWDGIEASDTLTKSLTILNTEPYAFKVSMTAEPLEETGPLQLLDEIHLTLKLDGRILYDGRVRGDEGVDMIRNALDLGNYESGQMRVLDISMEVSPEMKKYYWKTSEAFLKWNFYAVREVSPDEDGPKTGEIIKYGLYGVMLCMTVATAILIIVKKKQKKEESA